MANQQPTTSRMLDIVREYFPRCSDYDAHHIAITHTGFPAWWAKKIGESNEDCFRRQLEQFKDGDCDCPECSYAPQEKE